MEEKLYISDEVKEQIVAHGKADYPNECCGFLFGYDNGPKRYIYQAQKSRNAKEGDQRRRFEIHPVDYLNAEKYALANNISLIGIYHSHPDHPAIASSHDLLKAHHFFSYVIVSVIQGSFKDLKSWKLEDEAQVFKEEKVTIVEQESINLEQ